MIVRRIGNFPALDWSWRSPLDELERMRRQMDWLSENLHGGRVTEPFAGVFPLINVTEDSDGYNVRTELPGMEPGDLDISVTGNNLSITGERKIPDESGEARYHRRERESGRFSRVVALPGPIDPQKVEATSTDGVLTIRLPKAEAARPKQISIKTS